MAWDDISDLTWLQPRETPGEALTRGVQAGSAIASNWLRAAAMRNQQQQFDTELVEKQREFDAEMQKYRENVEAKNLLKLKAVEDKNVDAVLFAESMIAMNEAGKTGGADAVLSFQPKTFRTPGTYKLFSDAQIKLAGDLRNTAEAKEFAKLSRVDQAKIHDIKNSNASEYEKAMAIDAIFAASRANETPKRLVTTTQSDLGALKEAVASGDAEAEKALRRKLGLNDEEKRKALIDKSRIRAINSRLAQIGNATAANARKPDAAVARALNNERQTLENELAELMAGQTQTGENSQPTTPIAAPAKEERIKDEIYSTPLGDMKWTGTGWVKP